jgi:simple sugar transport system permease protein
MIYTVIEIMTPYFLAALGGLFTQRAGILNIALEGLILTGAFATTLFSILTNSLLLGVLLGTGTALLLSLLYGAISLSLKTNIFISGLAVNLLAAGMTSFISTLVFSTKGVIRMPEVLNTASLTVSVVSDSPPIIGPIFFGHSLFVYLSWLLFFVVIWIFGKTAFGLRIKATGLNPEMLRMRGRNPVLYQLWAILISGGACGLAGAHLAIHIGAFVPNISAGRGWIALVAIFLGREHPAGVLAACAAFAFAETLANRAQGIINIPETMILSFPYIVTFIGLVLFSALFSGKQREKTL